jgi:N-acetylglucosamine-6-phosphate deacetylase
LHHLPAEALKTFVRVKGADRIVLTSDCVHIAGLAPGEYELAGSPVELTREGRINLKGTSLLAGSGLMLLQGVLNVSRHTDFSLAQSFAAASDVPCRLFGQRYRFFSCAIGKRANFTLFDEKLGKVTPLAVLVDGVRAL